MRVANSPQGRARIPAGVLPVKTLRFWLLAGPRSIRLRPEEASLFGLADKPSQAEQLLVGFIEARRKLSEQTRAEPKGRMIPLSNPWPGKRSLIGPREWVQAQDVSSRALKKARYELPMYADQASDVDLTRHQLLLSDLRMAHDLYLRARREDRAQIQPSFPAAVRVALEYVTEGRADLLEQALLCSRESCPRFTAEVMLLALHYVDPARGHAAARRLVLELSCRWGLAEENLRWTAYLVLADDPSAEKLLVNSVNSSTQSGTEALGALFVRSPKLADAILELFLASSGTDDGPFLRTLRSLSVFPWGAEAFGFVSERILAGYKDPAGALMSRCPAVAPTREAAEALISKDSKDSRYRGRAEWARLLAACPPSEDAAVALFDGGDRSFVEFAQAQALPRDRVLKLLDRVAAGALEIGMDSFALCLSRVSEAEVYEIFARRIWNNRPLQKLMNIHHLPAAPSWFWGVHPPQLVRLRWDARWSKRGEEEGLPLVVAGLLEATDRSAVRWLMRAVGSETPQGPPWVKNPSLDQPWVLRRFSSLNLPERLDLLLVTLKHRAHSRRDILSVLKWARPWSDAPALLKLVEDLKRRDTEVFVDADLLEEVLEEVFFRPTAREWL